jgi:hypothetical protein
MLFRPAENLTGSDCNVNSIPPPPPDDLCNGGRSDDEEEVPPSDDEEQEDPKDYCVGRWRMVKLIYVKLLVTLKSSVAILLSSFLSVAIIRAQALVVLLF